MVKMVYYIKTITKKVSKTLKDYCSLDKNKIFSDKVSLKKNAGKYTMFQHYLALDRLLKL